MKSYRKLSALAAALAFATITPALGADAPTPDDAITKAVLQVFNAHPDLGVNLSVQTIEGTVYVSGIVSTGLDREDAESLAKTVPGVKRVVNAISLDK